LDGNIWALKANSLTSPLIITVTVTESHLCQAFWTFFLLWLWFKLFFQQFLSYVWL